MSPFKKDKDVPMPRRRRSSDLNTHKIPQTISYSDNKRLIRTDVNGAMQGSRDRNMRQIETINEAQFTQVKLWPRLLILAVLLIVILAGLSNGGRPTIVIVQPPGFSYMPHSTLQYQDAAAAAINSSLFNRFKLTISSNDIEAYMEQRFPEIAYVAVTVPFIGYTPTVHIQLSKPVIIYAVNNIGSYLVNPEGYIVADATSVSATELKGLITLNSPSLIAVGPKSQVLTSSSVRFIETVSEALALKKIQIAKMNLVPMAEELDVYPVGVPYYIKFNLYQSDALTEVGTYLATINTLNQQKIMPSQYIDVRLDGRAYYK